MGHISSIGAGMYSDLSIAKADYESGVAPATETQAGFDAEFGAAEYDSVGNVREFPAMGTPPNVVNVPVYGQATSQQIQGQSDAPSMEIQMNYVASAWADGTTLGDYVGDGIQHIFRFALLNAKPPNYDALVVSPSIGGEDTDNKIENSVYYWIGKVEALQVTPQLTDANTATVTITIQSDFFGAYTTTVTS